MRHCTADELLDLVEGTLSEASVPHLERCASCREQLRELRQVMSAVREATVPEPSPLFWDHLSARVHDVVASEPAGRAPSDLWWTRWIALPVAAALAALVVAGMLGPRLSVGQRPHEAATFDEQRPTASFDAGVASAEPAVQGDGHDGDVDNDDASIGIMMDLAGGLDLDAAAAIGWTVPTGAADVAVAGLSGDERRELGRLLREEMRGV